MMIPVRKQPEPEDFAILVRERGEEFLKECPIPDSEEWKKHSYWQDVLDHMGKSYKDTCAYSALWIPPEKNLIRSIDHFIPKSKMPSLAYSWDNFRYVSRAMNSNKGTKSIIDPFTLKPGWFEIDFEIFEIRPGKCLSVDEAELVLSTIRILKLDKEEHRNACQRWVMDYCKGYITFAYLKIKAPFIAAELERQDLRQRIQDIMKVKGKIEKYYE
ncbi:MAG: hypothetical protein GY765_06035 [bacterium]|nr:hypothetical protein [bacterium]